MNKTETGLSPEELKLYKEGKLYVSWRDDNESVYEMYENFKKEKEESIKKSEEMSKKGNETPKLFILPLIIAVILFISIAELPYGFYTFMRIVVPLLSAIYLFFAYALKDEFSLMLIPNIIIVILWNPILPIYLDKETWVVIDAIAGISQIVMAFYAYRLERNFD